MGIYYSCCACHFYDCTVSQWVAVFDNWDWKMFMSAMLGCSTISAALSTRPIDGVIPTTSNKTPNNTSQYEMSAMEALEGRDNTETPLPLEQFAAGKRKNLSPAWLLLYIPGLITGLTGLFSLVKDNWHIRAVQNVTLFMWGVPIVLLLFLGSGALCELCADEEDDCGFIGGTFSGFAFFLVMSVIGVGVLGALYSDWILGAIAGNYGGVPSGDIVWLYWGYFIAKKLVLGSW